MRFWLTFFNDFYIEWFILFLCALSLSLKAHLQGFVNNQNFSQRIREEAQCFGDGPGVMIKYTVDGTFEIIPFSTVLSRIQPHKKTASKKRQREEQEEQELQEGMFIIITILLAFYYFIVSICSNL